MENTTLYEARICKLPGSRPGRKIFYHNYQECQDWIAAQRNSLQFARIEALNLTRIWDLQLAWTLDARCIKRAFDIRIPGEYQAPEPNEALSLEIRLVIGEQTKYKPMFCPHIKCGTHEARLQIARQLASDPRLTIKKLGYLDRLYQMYLVDRVLVADTRWPFPKGSVGPRDLYSKWATMRLAGLVRE
jgi:hypothetical protein